ncbi:MAG: DNA mismatch repair endonuclease MutL [Flavobacteriia bacterium]|nr:DNA mismatch repair endonuclease MutL [Flavobacteriia bacterium]
MNNVIQILPDHIANQIAAGEVIQRPASVIKELVENSLDAQSDSVEVYIKDSGKTLIQISDNGIGMSEIDARMSFERHATSKIKNADDLFRLYTKGFRGEALASIAAIAHVELKTRMEEDELGTLIHIEGSQININESCTCKKGTIISIKNLFYNVPARRNFLKSDSVEFKHIEEEFIRVALAHPNVKFSLSHNDQLCYLLEKGNLRKRISDIFGKAYDNRIIPINVQMDLITLSGFVSKPEFSKKTRGEQYFFVNNRFFKDSFFHHAVQKSYEGLISPGTFPSYFIFFEIDPSKIDVNVHPTKTEIKFEYDKEIYKILKTTVKEGLGKFHSMPSLDFEQETSFNLPWEFTKKTPVEPHIKVDPNYNPFQNNSAKTKEAYSHAILNSGFEKTTKNENNWMEFYQVVTPNEKQETIIEEISLDVQQFMFFNPYLILLIEKELFILHVRRAKERIIYNEMMQSFIIHPIYSQQMLFPLSIPFSLSSCDLWNENKKLLNQLGFEFEIENNQIVFSGVPVQIDEVSVEECIKDINDKLMEKEIDKGELAHEFISTIAHKASIVKEQWNIEKCRFFFNQWKNCTENTFTPKGKKIHKRLYINDINQIFEHVSLF